MVSSPLFGLILCRPGLSHGHAASEEGADKGRIASLWGKLVIAIIVPTGPFLPFLLSFPLPLLASIPRLHFPLFSFACARLVAASIPCPPRQGWRRSQGKAGLGAGGGRVSVKRRPSQSFTGQSASLWCSDYLQTGFHALKGPMCLCKAVSCKAQKLTAVCMFLPGLSDILVAQGKRQTSLCLECYSHSPPYGYDRKRGPRLFNKRRPPQGSYSSYWPLGKNYGKRHLHISPFPHLFGKNPCC